MQNEKVFEEKIKKGKNNKGKLLGMEIGIVLMIKSCEFKHFEKLEHIEHIFYYGKKSNFFQHKKRNKLWFFDCLVKRYYRKVC